MNVLFLCTGNTCRSPLAAALFHKAFCVQSAGIAAWPGSPASAHSIAAAAELGCDISSHAAQQLTQALLDWADAIICLARNHALTIADHVPHAKLRLLGGGIADPFGGTLEDYRACAAQMQAAMPALLRDLHCTAQIVPAACIGHASHALTALVDDNVAGCISVNEVVDEADIVDIDVAADYRRRGIANKLLAQAELNAVLRGCTKVHLEVRPSNTAARALYEKRGYQVVGSRPSYYSKPTEDSILMTLEIR
ncbi:MAG: ribosomal protein S18-alanine N-acetyltransferase [Oscillospiraceae bacterium]|nr:ribosomal protein S18-alanine N-acetyltransferase [Oscillospiraceae bacterium]